MLSFEAQKVLILMESKSSCFYFVVHCFEYIHEGPFLALFFARCLRGWGEGEGGGNRRGGMGTGIAM